MQEKHYFQIIVPQTGKSLKIELLPNDLTPQLAPLFEKHSQWLSKQYNTVAPEFVEVKEGINTWLVDKYKINPTTKAFTQWFIVNRLNTATIKIDFKVDKATGELLPNVKLHFNFPDIDTTYTPAVIEKDLHEFCHWKQQQQEKINKVVTSSEVNVIDTVNSILNEDVNTKEDYMPQPQNIETTAKDYIHLIITNDFVATVETLETQLFLYLTISKYSK